MAPRAPREAGACEHSYSHQYWCSVQYSTGSTSTARLVGAPRLPHREVKRAVRGASPNGARVRGSAASEGARIRIADGALLAVVHWPLLLDCLN